MTTRIETYIQSADRWAMVADVAPGSLPGSITNITDDGIREIILFECAPDNSQTTIYRSTLGIDTEIGPHRIIDSLQRETINDLRVGESHEMNIRTDKGTEPRKVRFTHI